MSEKITGRDGWLDSGQRVVAVKPAIDGSAFVVVLDETIVASESARRAVESGLEDISMPGGGTLETLGIDVSVEYGPAATPATRNHGPSAPANQRFSGAYMQNGATACSTGFRMTQILGSVPAMGSAHHCAGSGGSEGQAWYYSSSTSYPLGNWYSPYGPGLSSGDIAVWKGSGVNALVPGIFIGDHTVSGSTIYAIKGAIHGVVGADVCYSGSRSGTVCSNRIQSTGNTFCYTGHTPCYNNLVVTRQLTGIPAAGNGDSGGPVYSTSSGIYATGLISGISSGTATCTGDAGSATGRKCSADVIYAPISELMANGYGLNYIP